MLNDLRRLGGARAAAITLAAALGGFMVVSALASERSPSVRASAHHGPVRHGQAVPRRATKPRHHHRRSNPVAAATATEDEGPAATPSAAGGSLAQAVGQKVMGQMTAGAQSASPVLLDALRRGELGGVIIHQDNIASAPQIRGAIAQMQAAAAAGGNPPLLISIDQEGGSVKRMPSAPPTLSPWQMGAAANPAASAQQQGLITGQALRAVGVNVDFAPVADVALSRSGWLGDRAYGSSPTRVADAVCAFAEGLQSAQVAATFKHFPGLGSAGQDSDFHVVTVDSSVSQLESRDWVPYLACPTTPALVMVSSGVFPALGSSAPAMLSSAVVNHYLRGVVGYRGVTVTDDMEVVGSQAGPQGPVLAARAGVDIELLVSTGTGALHAYQNILAAARRDPSLAARVRESAARIEQLKRAVAG